MNRLSTAKRAEIIRCLVEGTSVNATCRMTGAAKMTVLKLLRDLGAVTSRYQDEHLRNLTCQRVQADELWAFCHAKQKNVPEQFKGRSGYGSIWTWTALDADSKLMISWVVSDRNQEAADALKLRLVDQGSDNGVLGPGVADDLGLVDDAGAEDRDPVMREDCAERAAPAARRRRRDVLQRALHEVLLV